MQTTMIYLSNFFLHLSLSLSLFFPYRQSTLTVRGGITVQPVSSLTRLDLTKEENVFL